MTQNSLAKWRPNSLKQLVLVAFILVVTPLGVLLYQASNALVEQSAQGRNLAREALEISRRGQSMQQLAEDITRASRQYQILARDEIRLRLIDQINNYRQLLTIQSFALDAPAQIKPIYKQLDQLSETSAESEEDSGQVLIDLTRRLNAKLDKALDLRLKDLNTIAQNTQSELVVQASLLMGLSALMIIYFSHNITRPVQRLANRVRALGQGDRTFGSRIGGPRELVELDEQLDWLARTLQQLEGEKQRFLRHMSHELKTPLTTLREGSDLLAEEVAGDLNGEQREIVELLQQNAHQLQSLIEQLLDYNRLGLEEPIQPRKTDMRALVNEALSPHKLMLEQKKIQVSRPEKQLFWHTDRAMVLRILGNLISNATYYGSNSGDLNVSFTQHDKQLVIDVENSGPVIPEEDVPHLFDPFYQGSHRRVGAIKGSGIGLSIAKDAAQALGATLTLNKNQNNRVGFRLAMNALSDKDAN